MRPEPAGALGPIVEDRLLDGRLRLLQPAKGHRAGTDAVLLAASLPALAAGPLIDAGAGVGTVGLLAALVRPQLHVVLVERDPDLAALARENVRTNGLCARVEVVEADVTGLSPASLAGRRFACVAMNPPYYAPGEGRASPVPNRRGAHVAAEPLEAWLRAARRLLAPQGRLCLIHRAEALPLVVAGLGRGFGALDLRPVHARADEPAIRLLAAARLGSRRPAALLPGLVLHGPDGTPTPESLALHGRLEL